MGEGRGGKAIESDASSGKVSTPQGSPEKTRLAKKAADRKPPASSPKRSEGGRGARKKGAPKGDASRTRAEEATTSKPVGQTSGASKTTKRAGTVSTPTKGERDLGSVSAKPPRKALPLNKKKPVKEGAKSVRRLIGANEEFARRSQYKDVILETSPPRSE